MTDQVRVLTMCGVDVLNDQAVVLALWTNFHVRDEFLSPMALGPRTDEGAHLNGALPLDVAIGVYNKLGEAIEELARRQGVTIEVR